jgi:hypothetical protein
MLNSGEIEGHEILTLRKIKNGFRARPGSGGPLIGPYRNAEIALVAKLAVRSRAATYQLNL